MACTRKLQMVFVLTVYIVAPLLWNYGTLDSFLIKYEVLGTKHKLYGYVTFLDVTINMYTHTPHTHMFIFIFLWGLSFISMGKTNDNDKKNSR